MENKRKTFLITAVIIVIFLIIGAIVFFFFVQKEGAPESQPGTVFPGGGSIFPESGNKPGEQATPETTPRTGAAIPTDAGRSTLGQQISIFKPILRLVTEGPVAGGITVNKDKAFTRYMEREEGNTFETAAENILPVRLTNTTIAQVYSAAFNRSGESAIIQYLRTGEIQTFSGNVIQTGAGQGEFRGKPLAAGITSVALSPSGTKLAYIVPTGDGMSVNTVSPDGTNKVQLYQSPLRQWLLTWPKEDVITLNSKAGYNTEGILMYLISGKTNVMLSAIKGLTTLVSPDIEAILYSRSTSSGIETYTFNISSGKHTRLNLVTMPEKCVWSKLSKSKIYCSVPEEVRDGNYPDDWYQGLVAWRDEVWAIDTATGNTQYLINLGGAGRRDIDAINLSLDEKERFITFTNKTDLSLWTLQIMP